MSTEWTEDMKACIGALVQGLRMRRAAILSGDLEEFTAVDNAIGMTMASLDEAIGEWVDSAKIVQESSVRTLIAKCDECDSTDPNSPGSIIVEHFAGGGKFGYYRGSRPCPSRFHVRNQLVICDCESANIHDVGCPNRDILKQ